MSPLAGKEFGRLTILRCAGLDQRGRLLVEAYCQCFNVVVKKWNALQCGNTKSCGCLQPEIVIGRNTTHGLGKPPEYNSWAGMVQRCTNKTCESWKDYGARGISVCEEWLDFAAFYRDMGPRPSPFHSIDRLEVDGNYEPSNCRWATKQEQADNTTRVRRITVGSETKNIAQWSKSLGVAYGKLYARIERQGEQTAITELLHNRGKHVENLPRS